MPHLKRFHEFGGKHARFFGEVLRADPVVGHDGLVSLAEESFYFFRQVFLRGAELLPIGNLQILFRGCNVIGRVFLRCFQVPGGKLRRNLRRRGFGRRRFGRFRRRRASRRGGAFRRARAAARETAPPARVPPWWLTGGGASGGGMGAVTSGGGELTEGGAARTICLLAHPAKRRRPRTAAREVGFSASDTPRDGRAGFPRAGERGFRLASQRQVDPKRRAASNLRLEFYGTVVELYSSERYSPARSRFLPAAW